MKRFLLLIGLLFIVIGESRAASMSDYASLINHLRAAGIAVRPEGDVVQPFFTVKGKAIEIYGEHVQVFQYADSAEADAQATKISPDGSTVARSKIHWIGPPHFYRAGKLIILYVGNDDKVLRALADGVGQQFAGQ